MFKLNKEKGTQLCTQRFNRHNDVICTQSCQLTLNTQWETNLQALFNVYVEFVNTYSNELWF